MTIRKSEREDLPCIIHLIENGRQKMQAEGNMHQWCDGHPHISQLKLDIEQGVSYIVMEGETPIATFALIEGPDPTYSKIYDGEWLNEKTYHVIHRIASIPGVHGIMCKVMEFAFKGTDTIRIDTHKENITMRSLLVKYGFAYCGIIHLANGDERLAYQKTIIGTLTMK